MKINSNVEELYSSTENVLPHITNHNENWHYEPKSISDKIAKLIVWILARSADLIFKKRYGHRAIVLETIAAVPGIVGGMFQHLKSLRYIQDDRGWIKELIEEAENERMHLIIYSEINKPTTFERILIMIVQFFFFILYFILYFFSAKTAHRVVGYFEEEATNSYMHYLSLVKDGFIKNTPATETAKKYWNLTDDALLTDIIKATIKDELLHRDVNHKFADDKNVGIL